MQAVAEAQPMIHRQGGEPARAFAQGGAVGALGHHEQALGRDGVGGLQREHFGEVGGLGDDEFEESARVGGESGEARGDQREGCGVARMGQLGADVVLVDQRVERGRRGDGKTAP